MPETAAYSSTTTEDQHVIKITNPVKAWKNCTTDPVSFSDSFMLKWEVRPADNMIRCSR